MQIYDATAHKNQPAWRQQNAQTWLADHGFKASDVKEIRLRDPREGKGLDIVSYVRDAGGRPKVAYNCEAPGWAEPVLEVHHVDEAKPRWWPAD